MDEIHPEAAAMLQAARDIAEQRIFRERGKLELELACGSGLRVLLDVFFDAMDCLYEGRTPSFQGDKLLALTRLDNGLDPKVSYYTNAMKIMDFISGMTDNYAHFLAAGIQGYSGPERHTFAEN
jgi:dGTPase